MKREAILFYLSTDKLRLYRTRGKQEEVFEIDTSLFFEFGEISNVQKCARVLTKYLARMHFGPVYLKPDFIVLYNDVSHSDIKFLYRAVLGEMEANSIKFVPLTRVAKSIRDDENLVLFDKNYYTLVNRGEKLMNLETIDFEPVLIGNEDTSHLHYSEEDIVWRTFKSHFTNLVNCDNMDVGDDEC